jgi:hypothetical protein
MKTSQRYLVDVLVLGWIVLVACSVILFWARYYTWTGFAERFYLHENVHPSGLVPDEIERDPNVSCPSRASATSYRSVRDTLWLVNQDRTSWSDEQGDWPVVSLFQYAQRERSCLMYWDERSGLFVRRVFSHVPDTNRLVLQSHLYAGPEGVSERPGKELGCFTRPIVSYRWMAYQRWRGITYDTNSRQFYRIDWDNMKVHKGPAIAQGIDLLKIGPSGIKGEINLAWEPPLRKIREGETSNRGDELVPIEPNMTMFTTDQVMTLDQTGQVYRLDTETLTLSLPMGSLPVVGPRSSNRPCDLLAYGIHPVEIHGQYTGCMLAAVGAEGTTLEMSVYDKEGHPIPRPEPRYKAVFQEHSGASGALASQYLLECLHPVSLSLLSRAIGPQIEALAGHRGLFVLPYSFVATRAREQDSYPIDRLFWTVVMLLPAMVLAAFLAWKAAKDAATIGLSRTATRWWIVGIAAFGLPAYITYRLTRPQISLVTCANCGNPRRPDMDRCHWCRAPWVMPDLTAPAWRVMD